MNIDLKNSVKIFLEKRQLAVAQPSETSEYLKNISPTHTIPSGRLIWERHYTFLHSYFCFGDENRIAGCHSPCGKKRNGEWGMGSGEMTQKT